MSDERHEQPGVSEGSFAPPSTVPTVVPPPAAPTAAVPASSSAGVPGPQSSYGYVMPATYPQQPHSGYPQQSSSYSYPPSIPQGSVASTPFPQPSSLPPSIPQGAPVTYGHYGPTPGSTGSESGHHTGHPHRIWPAVITSAVVAALIAAGGTAALVMAFDDNGPAQVDIAGLNTPGQVDAAPVTGSSSDNPAWQAVAAVVSPSVVAIETRLNNGASLGSGMIYDAEGHVLTNNHVIDGSMDNTAEVTLADGRVYLADIVGTDPTTDLAVLKLQDPPSDLTPVALGDSSALVVGDPVLAVGNPLGLYNTVTTGIVSALNRPVSASDGFSASNVVTNAIQIDAAINHGNSGGPLFNAQGQVIGITSSIATTTADSGSIGLGFAIPINLAKNIAGQLISNGSAEHAFLGVSLIDGTATADGITRRGASVQDVTVGSPADEAGIQVDDVIVAINGKATNGAESLTAFVREYSAGDVVSLTVVRDGQALEITATLAVRDETALPQQPSGPDQTPGSGNDGGSDSGDNGDNPFGWLFPGN
jgi:putative serine protease PepD